MTMLAIAPTLAGWSAPGGDAAELRVLAAQVDEVGQRHASAVRALRAAAARLLLVWRGTAADAASMALDRLLVLATGAAAAHAEAADVLRVCAGRVEEAQVMWARAQDAERRDVADRAAGFDLPADSSPLRRHARQLAQEACALADSAHATAAEQLRELASSAPAGARSLGVLDHLSGAGSAAVDAVWGSVVLAASLSTPRLVRDPDGWLDDVRSLRDGAVYAKDHPAEAGLAAAGWDLLKQGRYGEWAGGFVPDLLSGALTGGAAPGARRAADLSRQLADLADDVDDLARLEGRGGLPYAPVAGGPVRTQPGAVMTPRYPRRIQALTPERQRHILDGDPPPRTGGGHRPGTGKPGKSEFPASWSDDDIIARVMETARHPHQTLDQQSRNVLARATFDGVEVQVVVHPDGRIITAYPLAGAGVVKNPLREGHPHRDGHRSSSPSGSRGVGGALHP